MNFRRFIKKLSYPLIVFAVLFAANANAQDAAAGEKLFNDNCVACHALDKKVIGPALRGVHERPGRTEKWLIDWIRNSPGMIAKGDPLAVKLYEENGKQNMNAFGSFTDADIKNILAYIKTAKPEETAAAAPAGGDAATTAGTATTGGGAGTESDVKGLINFLLLFIVIAVLLIVGAVFDILGKISRYTNIPLSNPHKVNAWLMIVFLVVGMGAVIWEFKEHGKYVLIDNAASEHGASIDSMLMITLWITGAVFVITQILLFVFAFVYRYDPKRKALYYPHNNTLEYIWTLIPAIALTVLVINGFRKWSHITSKAPEHAENVEIFAYQFGWNVRYAGADEKLGPYSFNFISGSNPLGLGVKSEYNNLVKEVDSLMNENERLYKAMLTIPDPTAKEKEEMAALAERVRLQKAHLSRLKAMEGNKKSFTGSAEDDLILKEIVLVKNKPINFVFRARDVIHSAYSPHFRMQMNVVPGMPTSFWFTPTKSTQEMRGILEDPKFDYYLYCAKICGAAHYNMRIKVTVVETEKEYEKWLAEQTPAFAPKKASAEPIPPTIEMDSLKKTDSGADKAMAMMTTANN